MVDLSTPSSISTGKQGCMDFVIKAKGPFTVKPMVLYRSFSLGFAVVYYWSY